MAQDVLITPASGKIELKNNAVVAASLVLDGADSNLNLPAGTNVHFQNTTGTAPFIVESTTVVTNLNADLLDGQSGSYYLDWTNVTNRPDPTITLTGAVTGSGTMTDLGNVSITTTATSDPTLTLNGDATGSATFTNLGNATLTVAIVDDSHNHIISNVDGLQTALDGKLSTAGGTLSGDLAIGDGTADTRIIIKKADNNVSDHIQFYNGTTRIGEIGTQDATWLRINQVTNKNIYTPRYIRADNGFFVDSTSTGIDGSGNLLGMGTGAFSGVITSTVAAGTAPFTIASDTLVTNLNADRLDGYEGSSYFRQSISAINSSTHDFNDYTTTGSHLVENWSDAGDTVANGPTGSYAWGCLKVTQFNGVNYVLQEYWPHNTDISWSRVRWGGTWTGWRESWGSGSDGSGSGLDADKLDGQEGSYYTNAGNLSSGTLPMARADTAAIADGGTKLATGDQIHTFVTGLGYTSNAGTVTSVTVTGNNGLTGTGTVTGSGTITISHADTSSQGSVDNSDGSVIQDVTLDGYGHVTALGTVNLDGRYYTETEINTFINRSYVSNQSATNLAVGWYTIAINAGDRASARFAIWDTNSSDHQTVIFYAAHHFGTDASNTLTVLDNSYFAGNPFRYIRIVDGGTYDGALLQIYIDDATNSVNCAIVGDNIQSTGWSLRDWIADGTDPTGLGNFSALTNEASKVDLNLIAQGGLATTGEIYAGGDTTQHRVFHDSYHPNADILTTARTIGGVSFNGSANINLPGVNTAGNQNTSGTAAGLSGTPNIIVGTVTSGSQTITGDLTVNPVNDMIIFQEASTNTDLQTVARFGTSTGGVYITSSSPLISSGSYYDGGWINTNTYGCLVNLNHSTGGFAVSGFTGATIGQATSWVDRFTVDSSGNMGVAGSVTSGGSGVFNASVGNIDTTNDIGQVMEKGNAALTTLRFDSDAWRLYAGGAGGSAEVVRVAEGGQMTIYSQSDAQLVLNGDGTSYAGIGFTDSSGGPDYIWWNGANSTFAIGGGGSNVAGKKLHVDGGVTIGAGEDAVTPPTNGLQVEGNITSDGIIYGNANAFAVTTTSHKSKYRLYGDSVSYAIGMVSSLTHGNLNDWAMTFQFDTQTDRGWWWGTNSHTNAQATMSLSTDGNLQVATAAWFGCGIDNTASIPAGYSVFASDDMKTYGSLVQEHNTSGGYIARPGGAQYASSQGATTGALKIAFPTHGTDDMMSFWVDFYDYDAEESYSMFIGGYLYQTTGNNEWVNTTAITFSKKIGKDFTVRFGGDGTQNCIWIGETTSTWNYPQVTVRDFQCGYSADVDAYKDGWALSFVTSFDTVDESETATYPVARTLKSLGEFAYFSPYTALEMSSAVDLNTLVAANAGFYYQTANADTTNNNYPSGQAGSLLVQKSAGNATQMYITYDGDPQLYIRANYQSGYSAWRRFINQTDSDRVIMKSNAGTSGYYLPNTWIDFNSTDQGLYWSAGNAAGWHMYPGGGSSMLFRVNGTTISQRLQTDGGTTRGMVYGTTSNEIGFLNNGGAWRLHCASSGSLKRDNTYTIWDSGNDGNASGLDADRLEREDNRTIAPSELAAGRLKFGFTSWANNNSSPYADFIHMRSYTDASGGSDNLLMFKKSGIGMRIWQQTWGSSTAYSSYEDVLTGVVTGTLFADVIAANEIYADMIAANAITAQKIQANAITANELEISNSGTGTGIFMDGTNNRIVISD